MAHGAQNSNRSIFSPGSQTLDFEIMRWLFYQSTT